MIAALRLLRAGLHLAAGCATCALVFPCVGKKGRLALRQRWSRQLLEVLGIRLDAEPLPLPDGAFVVANHVSWLDTVVVNALCPVAFVCKDEVRRWPVIGWLLARNGTVFIRRASARAARRTVDAVARRLAAGDRVAVFPEATTADGASLLPFRPALLQAAIDCGAPVQPLALRYSGPAAAFVGDMTLWDSLCAIAGARGLEARLGICNPFDAGAISRRQAAARARAAIQDRLEGLASQPGACREAATGCEGSGSAAGIAPSISAPIWARHPAVSRA